MIKRGQKILKDSLEKAVLAISVFVFVLAAISIFESKTGTFTLRFAVLGMANLVIAIVLHLSDRRQREQADRFTALTEVVPLIIWSSDKKGNIDYYNSKWTEYTGLTIAQTSGWGWSEVLHPEDTENCIEKWAAAIKTGAPYEIEYRFRRASDGAYRWHLGRALPIRDKRGKITRWFGTCTDIDEQKTSELARAELVAQERAASAVQLSEARLRAIFDSAFDAIVAMDDQGLIRDWNPRAQAIFGYDKGEVTGKHLSEVIFPDDYQETHGDEVENFFKTDRQNHKPIEILARKRSGETFPIQLAINPIQTGTNLMFTAFIEDITERTRKEQEIFEANKALKAATKAKSEFLANMSHEIRTPINGVLGMIDLLLGTPLEEQQRNYAETARSSADSLLALVNDILDLSKAEAGKIKIETIDFAVSQVISDVEKTLFFAARMKNLKIRVSLEKDLPLFLKGDPTRLRQILVNLVNNAIKFTSHGEVTIEAGLEDAHPDYDYQIRFCVIDTGIGIPPEALGRMFQPFSQADSSTTRKFGGTGLGLSICKHLTTLMGGDIGVTSQEGHGSCFWFSLPFKKGVAQVLPDPSDQNGDHLRPDPEVGHQRILVAEDNLVNQIIARKVLEKMGHSVVMVANGSEALDALRTTQYDLVLMDCQMPELDGYEATRIIRASKSLNCNHIPIIAMTANAMSGDREKCLESGMDDYISKPMKAEDLQSVIARTMKTKRIAA